MGYIWPIRGILEILEKKLTWQDPLASFVKIIMSHFKNVVVLFWRCVKIKKNTF